MARFLLITRPAADARALGDAVAEFGFVPLFAPALEIVDRPDVPLPPTGDADAVIFSSANAVRALMRRGDRALSAYRALPVYAVAEHTAEAARGAGFIDIRTGPGTMAGLAAQLSGPNGPVRMIHFRGVDIRDDPAVLLPGRVAHSVPLYQAMAIASLPVDVGMALCGGGVGGVVFYSARSAKAFMDALCRGWPGADLSRTKALCIAPPVIDSLMQYGVPWSGLLVSQTPDQTGMLSLIAKL